MKKLLLLLIAVITACFALIGCGTDNQPQKKTFVVTFDSQGGSSVASQEVTDGGLVNRPDMPERPGYYLNGWYTSPSTSPDTEWHFETDRVTEDITLYAVWTVKPEQEEITKMYLTINGNKIEVTLAENPSASALVEILKRGDITYTASDYGGFEKVGSLGATLPTSNTQITTQAGDVILYSGNQIVLFYGSNTWSYTRLGKISGYTVDELKALLAAGKGDIQVTISLK